jgi:hypothetical protein
MNFARTSKNTQLICLNSDPLAKRKYKIHKLVLFQSVEYSKRQGFDVEDTDAHLVRIYPHFVRNYKTARKIVTEYEKRKEKKIEVTKIIK